MLELREYENIENAKCFWSKKLCNLKGWQRFMGFAPLFGLKQKSGYSKKKIFC